MDKHTNNGVRCNVERCIYHDGCHGCNASKIEVSCGGSPQSTMCSTFCEE